MTAASVVLVQCTAAPPPPAAGPPPLPRLRRLPARRPLRRPHLPTRRPLIPSLPPNSARAGVRVARWDRSSCGGLAWTTSVSTASGTDRVGNPVGQHHRLQSGDPTSRMTATSPAHPPSQARPRRHVESWCRPADHSCPHHCEPPQSCRNQPRDGTKSLIHGFRLILIALRSESDHARLPRSPSGPGQPPIPGMEWSSVCVSNQVWALSTWLGLSGIGACRGWVGWVSVVWVRLRQSVR